MAKIQRHISKLTSDTIAVILAGGKGSRLKGMTDWRAKPAVPFGGKFRIIDFPLSNCINSGIRRVSVVTQYKSHSLQRHINRGWSFLSGQFGEFVEVLSAQQRMGESWYEGTADAVYQNLDILREHSPKYVLILAGDHIYKMDYGQMLAAHVKSGANVTVGCLPIDRDEASAFGVMAVDEDGKVTDFKEKPADPPPMPGNANKSLCSMGIYVFNADYLRQLLLDDAKVEDSRHDFGADLIPTSIKSGTTHAFRFMNANTGAQGYWRDVGTIDAYWEANMDLANIAPQLNLYDKNWPIWTYQEQLPPAKFGFDEDTRCGKAIDSIISGGCLITGSVVRRSVLFSNVRVHSFSNIEDSIILPDVTIERHARLKRCVVDKGVTIPEGLVVGENAEEDARRFYRSENGIILITPEMLDQSHVHGI
ncbi:MAG: glucose-1-phosphate adenylyltransferase [Mariprofundales bacterium]